MKQNTFTLRPAWLALTLVTFGTCAGFARESETPPAVVDIEKSDPFRKDAKGSEATPAQNPSAEMLDAQARILFDRGETEKAIQLQRDAVEKAWETLARASDNLARYAGPADYETSRLTFTLPMRAPSGSLKTIKAACKDAGVTHFSVQVPRNDAILPSATFTASKGLSQASVAKVIEACSAAGVEYILFQSTPMAGKFESRDQIDKPPVNVGGFVRRPGHILATEGLTLYAAVQAAGGVNEFGSIYRVALFRDGKHTTFDLSRKENWDIPVRPNDIIDVPQRTWRGR